MAFTITYDGGRIATWNIEEEKPAVPAVFDIGNLPVVTEFLATGRELNYLSARFDHLKIVSLFERSDGMGCLWRSWDAQFIYDNLPLNLHADGKTGNTAT